MSDSKHSGLYLRVVSGVILAPLALFALIYGGWPFAIMIGLCIGLATHEWLEMARLSKRPALNFISGFAYILVCFAAIVHVRVGYGQGAGLALALLLSVWASDIGAYFSGKAIGGPKMAPSISPNKTWAGLIGGMVASTLVFAGFVYFAAPWIEKVTSLPVAIVFPPLWMAIFLGVLITLAGQAGDLLISAQKRKVGVKDTGKLIPGHGGLLDRIDALLLASVAFVLSLLAFEALGL